MRMTSSDQISISSHAEDFFHERCYEIPTGLIKRSISSRAEDLFHEDCYEI